MRFEEIKVGKTYSWIESSSALVVFKNEEVVLYRWTRKVDGVSGYATNNFANGYFESWKEVPKKIKIYITVISRTGTSTLSSSSVDRAEVEISMAYYRNYGYNVSEITEIEVNES